jgi:hypothetical protein
MVSSNVKALPYVAQSSPNASAMDSTALRTSMDVGTIVGKAEHDTNTTKSNRPIGSVKPQVIIDYMYRRTSLELIIHGILGTAIGLSTYWEYFF